MLVATYFRTRTESQRSDPSWGVLHPLSFPAIQWYQAHCPAAPAAQLKTPHAENSVSEKHDQPEPHNSQQHHAITATGPEHTHSNIEQSHRTRTHVHHPGHNTATVHHARQHVETSTISNCRPVSAACPLYAQSYRPIEAPLPMLLPLLVMQVQQVMRRQTVRRDERLRWLWGWRVWVQVWQGQVLRPPDQYHQH